MKEVTPTKEEEENEENDESLIIERKNTIAAVKPEGPIAIQTIETPCNSEVGVLDVFKLKSMQLFGFESDCNTRILRALLLEADIEVDYTELVKGQKDEEYERWCPEGAIPCLVDDSKVIFGDIDVFARYLAEVNPKFEGTLFPLNDRLKFEQIMAWYFTMVKIPSDMLVDSVTSQVFKPAPSAEGENDELFERHMESFKRCLEQLNDMLSGREYICTEEISWVDVVLYAATSVVVKLCDLDDNSLGESYQKWARMLEQNENMADINSSLIVN